MIPGVQCFLYPEELAVRLAGGPGGAGVRARLRRCQRGARLSPRAPRVPAACPGQQPRDREHRVLRARPCRYGELAPSAVADPALQDAVLRFRDACGRAGIGFSAWLVGLHHEGLAARHPRGGGARARREPARARPLPLCSRGGGDTSPRSRPTSAARFEPEAIDLEAWLYPAWEPSYTLTLALEPLHWRAAAPRHAVLLRALPPACSGRGPTSSSAAPGEPPGRRSRGRATRWTADGCSRSSRARERWAQPVSSPRWLPAVHREGVELADLRLRGPRAGRAPGPSRRRRRGGRQRSRSAARALSGAELSSGSRVSASSSAGGTRRSRPTGRPSGRLRAMADDVTRLVAAGAGGLALYNLSLVPEAGLDAFRAAAARLSTAAVAADDGRRRARHDRRQQGCVALAVDDAPRAMERLGIDTRLSRRRRESCPSATARATSSSPRPRRRSDRRLLAVRRRDAVARRARRSTSSSAPARQARAR